jgi:hypothetical protein
MRVWGTKPVLSRFAISNWPQVIYIQFLLPA